MCPLCGSPWIFLCREDGLRARGDADEPHVCEAPWRTDGDGDRPARQRERDESLRSRTEVPRRPNVGSFTGLEQMCRFGVTMWGK